jgi:predicted alpha/beta-fold hydrolase
MDSASFSPPILLRNPHLQTVLSSNKLRLINRLAVTKLGQKKIVDAGNGVRLSGILSSPQHPTKGMVILLHGWEGSANSTYCIRTAEALIKHGYKVFRLNLRDHGNSHHLNQGLFYASLIEEVYHSVAKAADMAGEWPVYIVGFSLGGNFALRVALRCGSEPIKNLRYVYCISPVLDPEKATNRIDAIAYIRHYFMKKWRRSLKKKQILFPEYYDFSKLLTISSVGGLTGALLSSYSHFSSKREYFRSYTLVKEMLRDLPLPATILTAADDPIIPLDDFTQLILNHQTKLIIQPYGGHNGFIEDFSLRSWYEKHIISVFDNLSIQ